MARSLMLIAFSTTRSWHGSSLSHKAFGHSRSRKPPGHVLPSLRHHSGIIQNSFKNHSGVIHTSFRHDSENIRRGARTSRKPVPATAPHPPRPAT
eukprot:5333432-Lingulodinium_polyedra.AAC.1